MQIEFLQEKDVQLFFDKIDSLSRQGLGFPPDAIHHFNEVWSQKNILDAIKTHRHIFLCAWHGEELAGILLGTPPEGGVGTIIWVLVETTFRGQGVGGLLLEEAYTQYRNVGCHKIKLTIPDLNLLKFYEKHGMKLEGFHHNHWWKMEMWSLGAQL